MGVLSGLLALVLALLSTPCHAQDNTFGTEFVFMFMSNVVERPLDKDVEVHVYNPNQSPVQVRVDIPGEFFGNCQSATIDILPGVIGTALLCWSIRHTHEDGSISDKMVRVTATQPVSVISYNSERYSADGTLVWPMNTLGHYYTVSTYALPQIATQFGIVAPHDDTTITLRLPFTTDRAKTLDFDGYRYSVGEPVTFTMRAGSTFHSYNYADQTGTTILASKPVAVFSGNMRTWTQRFPSRDYLVEQLHSGGKWGTEFVYIPAPRDSPGDILKLICRKGTCRVTITGGNTRIILSGLTEMSGPSEPTFVIESLEEGSFYEVMLGSEAHIQSDGQIMVSVIVRSQNFAGSSDHADPSFYVLPHVGQYFNNYRTPVFNYTNHMGPFDKVCVLVAIQAGLQDGVRVDGGQLPPEQVWTPIGPYMTAVVNVNPAMQHSFTHTSASANFMAVHYGASDRESFAVVLGSIARTSVGTVGDCVETPMVAGDGIDNDCDGEADEEVCENTADDDNDGIIDEDCEPRPPDYIGKTFVLAFLSNNNLGDPSLISQLELYFTALVPGTTVRVTAPAHQEDYAPNEQLSLTLGVVSSLVIDYRMKLGNNSDFDENNKRSRLGTKAILVEATYPILIYGVNKRGYSTDSFSCFPVTSTGYVYRPVTQFPISRADDGTLVGITAHDKTTHLKIDLKDGVIINLEDEQYIGGPESTTGTIYVTLLPYHTLELQSNEDLSGIYIASTNGRKFSVFSGNIRNKSPLGRQNRDHLVEQVPPINTWGRQFVVTTSPRPDPGDFYKVVAAEFYTTVRFRQSAALAVEEITLLEPGDTHTFEGQGAVFFEIIADKPIMLAQIVKSMRSGEAVPAMTDPSMIIISPVEQWSANYSYITPLDSSNLQYNNTLWTITRREFVATMVATMGNGQSIPGLTDLASWQAVQGLDSVGRYYARNLPVGSGQISLSNTNGAAVYLGVMFGRSDRESYGNQISQLLRSTNLNVGCIPTAQVTNDGIDNDCDGITDEESCNGRDDDRDSRVDEDCATVDGFTYPVVFQDNIVERPRFFPLEVYISNGNLRPITCHVRTPLLGGGPLYYDKIVHINPTGVATLALGEGLRIYGTTQSAKAIFIICTEPATVMGVNKETYSNDAFQVHPTDVLSTEYYTVSYGPATIRTQFAVVAVSPGMTIVSILATANIVYGGIPGISHSVVLMPYETFQAQSAGDLTGTRIRSDKPVAVYSGNVRTNVLLSGSRDHIVAMLPPTVSYGMEFNVAPTVGRMHSVSDQWRMVAPVVGTIVYIASATNTNCQRIPTQANMPGTTIRVDAPCQFTVPPGSAPFHVSADRPILLVQIQTSQSSARDPEKGDPCMTVVHPVANYVNQTNLVTPLYTQGAGEDLLAQYTNWVSLIVPLNQADGLRYNKKRLVDPTILSIQGTSDYEVVNFQISGGYNSVRLTHENPSVRFSGRLSGNADRETYCISIGMYPTV